MLHNTRQSTKILHGMHISSILHINVQQRHAESSTMHHQIMTDHKSQVQMQMIYC